MPYTDYLSVLIWNLLLVYNRLRRLFVFFFCVFKKPFCKYWTQSQFFLQNRTHLIAFVNWPVNFSEVYLKSCETSTMEIFCENTLQLKAHMCQNVFVTVSLISHRGNVLEFYIEGRELCSSCLKKTSQSPSYSLRVKISCLNRWVFCFCNWSWRLRLNTYQNGFARKRYSLLCLIVI